MRYPILVLTALTVLLSAPTSARTEVATVSNASRSAPTSAQDYISQALDAAKRKRWQQAIELATKSNNPVVEKLVKWMHYTNAGATTTFPQLARFIDETAGWPRHHTLRRKAETALADGYSDALVISWLTKYPPLSMKGRQRLAEAYFSQGKVSEGIRLVRRIWINNNLDRKQSRKFYSQFKRYLGLPEHKARLDRLLWDRERGAARRMLSLLPRGHRFLAEARLALIFGETNVDGRLARVPHILLNDPGLVYDRIRWRRKRSLDGQARSLLKTFTGDRGIRPEKWWVERRIQVRNLLRDRKHRAAYAVAAAHGQLPGKLAYSEAEWLAGWIALRFLGNTDAAAAHFRQLYEAVETPISRARGAYWRGRVSEVLGRRDHAISWYKNAARYPTTYYGQLAAETLDTKAVLRVPRTPVPRPEQWSGFKRRELVQIAELLGEQERWPLFQTFILHLGGNATTPIERVMVAGIASRFRRYEQAVRVGKMASREGQHIVDYSYPLFRLPEVHAEPALVFAIMRQESEFSARAVSPVGARGLMQLMPGTAKQMGRSMGLRYSRRALLSDPNYNVRLGSAYIVSMLEKFGGSYPLAIAAYNAGPGRVKEWLDVFGDPRNGRVDVIDWVEMIPFNETRNYVQRVMEGLQVYRLRLSDQPVRSRLTMDLNGGARHR